jgi:hypothetical protein
MTTKYFSMTDVMDALRKVVANQGEEHIYKTPSTSSYPGLCVYVEQDEEQRILKPSCIVGHVLWELGVPLDRLNIPGNAKSVCYSLSDYGYFFDPNAIEVLQIAQSIQDHGVRETTHESICTYCKMREIGPMTWGRALKAAEVRAKLLGWTDE